jgi:hypothetical protein
MNGDDQMASLLIHRGANLLLVNGQIKTWREVVPPKDRNRFKNIEKIGQFTKLEKTSSVKLEPKPRSASNAGSEKSPKNDSTFGTCLNFMMKSFFQFDFFFCWECFKVYS